MNAQRVNILAGELVKSLPALSDHAREVLDQLCSEVSTASEQRQT